MRDFRKEDIVQTDNAVIKSVLRKTPKTPGRLVKFDVIEEQEDNVNANTSDNM